MKLYHNTRDESFRAPSGAVATGTPVTLTLEAQNASDITVSLRTWVDGVGETRYKMARIEPDASDVAGGDAPTRYQATLTPDSAGVIWYQFVIVDNAGREMRYGARDGATGGEGRLLDWEPPSFKLTAYAANDAGIAECVEAGNRAFEQALVAFLRRDTTAYDLVEALKELHENQPADVEPQSFICLERTDRARLFAQLAGVEPGIAEGGPACDLDPYGLDEWRRNLAKGRLWCTCLIEMLSVDAPAVFGDTPRSMDGPNRVAELWKTLDGDCADIVRNAAELRLSLSSCSKGSLSCFAVNDDVFGFVRDNGAGEAVCVLINASTYQAHDVSMPLMGEAASDVLDGFAVRLADASSAPNPIQPSSCMEAGTYACAHLGQTGSAVLYFHPKARLERAMDSGVGVLAHITSLPTRGKRGTLGAPARKFVDWLAKADVRYWQVLPVNPTDSFGSPYAGISAFAGNVELLEGGFDTATFASSEIASVIDEASYRDFCTREADWLDPYAYFMAIRQLVGENTPWQDWPLEYRAFDAAALADNAELNALSEPWRRAQFAFDRQWRELRAYANERGVQIVGDMPIYVSSDSADVWSNPGIFQLGADGRPAVVAGCPPDRFAEDGQVWGNPVYDWDKLAADGYSWWLRRLERAFDLYDWVRLDHFIGFARYFSIPAGHKAADGAYRLGPGKALFDRAFAKFGALPIIAEDLGTITPAVRALSAACGFPGMDIVQFVDGNDPLARYCPRPEKVTYTGTHDNQTLVGYCAERYPDLDARKTATTIAESVLTCDAPLCILPLQDVIGLGDEARMNVPGTAEGNWTWQAKAADVKAATGMLKHMVEIHRGSHLPR